MNNYRKILAYFLIGCLFLFVAAAFGGKIRLKYGPAEGTLSTYRMKVRAFSAVTDFGKMASKNAPANFTTYGNFVFTSTVEKKDKDGAVTEKITYKESKLEMEVAGIRTPLDFSEKMKNTSFTTKTAENGELLKIEGLEELAGGIKDLRMGSLYSQMNPSFPSKEVKIGESWNTESNSSMPIMGVVVKTNVKTKYTLTGFKKTENSKCAVITAEIVTETQTNTVKKTDDFVTDVTMSGKGSGEIIYDYEKSRINSCAMKMDMTSTMKISALNESSTMKTEQKIDMEMNLVKNE